MAWPDVPGTVHCKDVSHHQSVSDWADNPPPVLIARATYGTAKDDRVDNHLAKARSLGLITGTYHANVRQQSVNAQVDAYLAASGEVDLYALDVEPFDADAAFTPDQARAFVDRFHDRTNGKAILLYHSESGYPAGAWHADGRWVANWGPAGPATNEPDIPWDVWQFGGQGGEDGNLVRQSYLDEVIPMKPLIITATAPKLVSTKAGAQLYNPDGTVLVKNGVTNPRPSPYEVQFPNLNIRARVLNVTTATKPTMALVKLGDTTAIVDPPVPVDDTPFSQADLDAAKAQGAAEGAQAKSDQIAAAEAARLKAI